MTPTEFINLDLKNINELLDKYYKPGIEIKKLVRRVVPRSFNCKKEKWPKVYKGMMIDPRYSIICLRYLNILIEFKIDYFEGRIAFLEKYTYRNGMWYEVDSY